MKLFSHLRRPSAAPKAAGDAVVTQRAYIAEAAFEYFVTLTTSGAFLTLLIKQMEVSDALTGILSSVTILACSFQMFAVTFVRRRRSIKAATLFLQTLQQVLFSLLFLLPFFPLSNTVRVVLFSVLFLFSSILINLVSPAKFNWMMSFVPPGERGKFTARKEMVSLITGLVYNYIMSRVVDHFDAIGRPQVGLQLCAAVIFVLMLFHVATLLIARDAPQVLEEVRRTPTLRACMRSNFANPRFWKCLVFGAGWNFFYYMCIPYHNIYLLQELGCSFNDIAVDGIVCSLARFLFSMPLGRFSDRYGFDRGVSLGFLLVGVGLLLLVPWVPGNGKVLYLLFQFPFAAAMAALSGGMMNILYQYVPSRDRVSALGIYSTCGGLGGFLGSLIGGWILGAIQAGGNRLFGLALYPQQFLNLLGAAGMVGLALFTRLVVSRMEREPQ